jgi:AraC family transcriptional regulator of adaptative response/methylated-DNA-[protein]-cysteine methyltransferase
MVATEKGTLEAMAQEVRCQAQAGGEMLDMERLLKISHWSRRQTERLFRGRFVTSPQRYFRDCQWEIAERLLKEGDDVLSATIKSGFASPGRLHDAMVQRRGMTPGEIRRRGAGVCIEYGFFETQLGVVLLAATSRGLCALRLCQFHGAQQELDELHVDFPAAKIMENPGPVQIYADQLVAFLEARTAAFCPALDILSGTTFQREVWAELQKLSPGETISYTDLARRVGRPSAVRAVASACARNHLAIAVPCHRAVRQDGSLAGFRWGIEWKQRLLEMESRMKTP